ncbi:MAG: uroporphyrinogen-III synthase [Zavarzinella sp.]|nr:uroporphyrinogen-III synthase [Zavarzinella sp.]
MALPLEGMTIALAEGRQLEDLAKLLEKEGATPFRCPMLAILDAPEPKPVTAWLKELAAGKFDLVVLLTGEGLRRLIEFADRAKIKDAVVAALGKVTLVTRGPKPGQALKEIGLKPDLVAAAPTTDGVITTLKRADLSGKTVGVQLYSESNPPLTDFLAASGAKVRPVQPYVYAPAADADRVTDLIQRAAGGAIDAIVFTSSPQVDRVFEVAAERNLQEAWKRGLDRMKVASVGPVVSANLRQKGARVDIQPEQGFQMKNLVVHIKRALTGA